MSVVVVTPPTEPLIDLAVAKAHLRVDHDDHDTLILGFIYACADWLEGPTGILGQILSPQTLRADGLWRSACGGYVLPYGPVQSIDSVGYVDAGGLDQVVADDLYEIDPAANRVRLLTGQAWPFDPRTRASVTYVAGYESGALPAAIQSAILLHLNILYDQPDERQQVALERARDALLSPKRKRRV